MPGPGESAIGGYVLEAKLGEGAFGTVYRARNPALPDKRFAIKVLGGAPNPNAAARFRREMETLAKLPPHPNVVRIHAGSLDGERPYFVMELVDGVSLARLAAGGRLDPRRAAKLVRDAARGVAHVHATGVLHRDLKPENILVDREDAAKVCDFGLARSEGSERLTRTGAFIGTPQFAAPEQLTSAPTDVRTDVYALGGTLWFALVGRPPVIETDLSAFMVRVLRGEVEPPSQHRPGVPRTLDAICLRALAKTPPDRYQTVADLVADLDAFLAGRPSSVDGARAGSGRRGLAAAALLVVVLAAASAAAVTWRSTDSDSSPRPLAPSAADDARARAEEVARLASALAAAEHPDARTIEAAAKAADAALAARSDDPRARALRANATLARARAPLRALGAGVVGAPLDGSLDDDLVAASTLPGEAGARAAWLRADLLLASGPASRAKASAAMLEAARHAPGASERAALEELAAAAPPDEAAAVALFARLRDARDAASGRALARLLGAWGAPGAIEPRDADPWPALPRELVPADDVFTGVSTGTLDADLSEAVHLLNNVPAKTPQEVLERLTNTRTLIARGLRVGPLRPTYLLHAANADSDRLTSGLFLVLAASRTLQVFDIVDAFTRGVRVAVGVGAVDHAGTVNPPVVEFDATLDRDVREDELVAAALEGGLDHEFLDAAVRGFGGLRRLDELVAADAERRPADPKLTFEALRRLEDLVRVAGPAALPFRARLRLLGLGGPLGDALAARDLGRVIAAGSAATQHYHRVDELTFLAAAIAAHAPERSASRARWVSLYELGVAWSHARLRATLDQRQLDVPLERRESELERGLANAKARFSLGDYEAIRLLRGDARLAADWRSTPEDRADLKLGRPFTPPRR